MTKFFGYDNFPQNFKFGNDPLLKKVYDYARACHDGTNQTYDGESYFEKHILRVFHYALKYIHLIPEKWQLIVLYAALCHDLMEDCRETYNDLVKIMGEKAADIVYACTNKRGKTREKKANKKYYRLLKKTPGGEFVKVCDRLANVSSGVSTGHEMAKRYKKEHPHFREQLQSDFTFAEMWHELKKILYTEDEILSMLLQKGDLIEHIHAGPTLIIADIYVQFNKNQSPANKYPSTTFICTTIEDMLNLKEDEVGPKMTVLTAHEVQMHY